VWSQWGEEREEEGEEVGGERNEKEEEKKIFNFKNSHFCEINIL
jgi:hypothetical protein